MDKENLMNLPASPSNNDKKGVIILGETGVGKSNLGNFIIKSKSNKFKTSSSINSETQHVAFGESEEGKWVKENCYKYGFIIRYPEGKEDITGYDNEPWHFRYVGEEVAKKIYEEQITFDEYYAYYIEK
jgi:D-alanyl-D-alanine carboxypeptidase